MKTNRLRLFVLGLAAFALAATPFLRAQVPAESAPVVAIVDAPPAPAFADAAPSTVSADPAATLIADYAAKYPLVVSILSLVGLLRLVFKPVLAWLHARAAATPGTEDDERLARVEASWWMRVLRFLLDWGASIKLR